RRQEDVAVGLDVPGETRAALALVDAVRGEAARLQTLEGRAEGVLDAVLDARDASRRREDALEGAGDRSEHAETRVDLGVGGVDRQAERAVVLAAAAHHEVEPRVHGGFGALSTSASKYTSTWRAFCAGSGVIFTAPEDPQDAAVPWKLSPRRDARMLCTSPTG